MNSEQIQTTFSAIVNFLLKAKIKNAFDKIDGKTMKLSTSFRFNKRIADLANKVLASRYDNFKKKISFVLKKIIINKIISF